MPATQHDLDRLDNDHVAYHNHAHYLAWYIGTTELFDDHPDLKHGEPATRVYNLRGDWYAVHTH